MVHLLNVAGCAAAACACWPEPVSSWRCDLWPRLVKTPFTWGWGWGGVSEYALLCSVQYAGPSVKVKLLAEYNIHQGSQKHHNNNNKFSIDNTSSNNTNSAVSQVKCDADAVYFFFLILIWPHTTKSGSRRSGSRVSFSWSCVKAAAAVAAQLAVAESVSAAPSQSQSASRR